MTDFKARLGKGAIAVLGLIGALMRPRPAAGETRNVLIFFRDYGIGDAIVFLDVLRQLPLLYPPGEGFRLCLAADAYACGFWSKIGAVPEGVELLPLALHDRASVRDFLDNRRKLMGLAWEQVVFFHPMGAYYRFLLMGLSCREIVAEGGELEAAGRHLDRFLPGLRLYAHAAGEMAFEAYQHLLQMAVGGDVLLCAPSIPPLPPENRQMLPEGPYCVFSCGIASDHVNQYRAWPLERFAEVMSYVWRELGLAIVLSGSPAEGETSRALLSLLPKKCRSEVLDLTGRTDFAEWVALTRGAAFVFGNDSGYTHLAAAVGTPAFTIMGWHNHGRYLPYRLASGKKLPCPPILLEAPQPPCHFCNCPWLWQGQAEAEECHAACERSVQEKGIYSCVESITAAQAIAALKKCAGSLCKT